MALINKLQAIANAIRSKTGKTEQLSLDNMVTEIEGIKTGGSDGGIREVLLTGDYSGGFSENKFAFLLDKTKYAITTKDISQIDTMFQQSDKIEEIPFELNLLKDGRTNFSYIFQNANKLTVLPRINWNNTEISGTNSAFSALFIREVPDDYFKDCNFTFLHNQSVNIASIFNYGCSLRRVPKTALAEFYSKATSSYASFYYYGFNNCYALEEAVNLPVGLVILTKNVFLSTFNLCGRIKSIKFSVNEDGTPKKAQWKAQTIDLTEWVGVTSNKSNILNYNSGITADKEVTDDATYQALKNDADWFTCNVAYSRYNHDSAVNTINSLPDTSSYLASAGGTNTIKFKGAAGAKTDGGAINTLTEEEIAVAAAKGWTVTLV